MRHHPSDLPVLGVEQYGSGRSAKRPAAKANIKTKTTAIPSDTTRISKKRGRRRTEAEQTDSAEEPKRTRGRPRLETKDQTPTERRRTQIRLAQRAYRNRKENAITDLQAKINDLKDVNSEINNAYRNLFDFASQSGLLSQAPEFGQQLQRLQTLVDRTQKESPKTSDLGSPEENADDDLQEVDEVEELPQFNDDPVSSSQGESQTSQQQQQLWGGLMVSHEPQIQQGPSGSASNFQHQAHEYEVITAPTLENASFPPNLAIDMNFMNPADSSWAQHPWNRLTGPRTMSFNEWTFARRLHRHASERAGALINMPNPPPAKFSRVFGFVMLFETIEEIRTRTAATIRRIHDEPLSYWEHPFHRLGGSGTHYAGQPSSLSGSSSYESSGYAMGPFNERTTRVRDTLLGASQYINMTGWEGTWYDSGEVETYLAQNGIMIHSAADIETVEVQPGAFSDQDAQPQIQLMQTIPPHAVPTHHGTPSFDHGLSSHMPPQQAGGSAYQTRSDMSSSSAINNNNVPTTHDGSWHPISVTSSLYGEAQTVQGGMPAYTGLDNMAANVFPNSTSYLFPHHESGAATMPPAVPRRVMLDVNSFIDKLLSHATCLGRAPAFRPRDIVKAFWEAVIAD